MLPPTAIGLNGELMEALLKPECAHESSGDLVQNADYDSVGLRGDMRVCMPGDAEAVGLQTTLYRERLCETQKSAFSQGTRSINSCLINHLF